MYAGQFVSQIPAQEGIGEYITYNFETIHLTLSGIFYSDEVRLQVKWNMAWRECNTKKWLQTLLLAEHSQNMKLEL